MEKEKHTSKISAEDSEVNGKNIIVCSDGTGNKGGKGYGTNVWRIYNSVDINEHTALGVKAQITYYDDGVGTDENKYLKAFSGAFGWGISRNIKQAYKFLCRNYQEGDHVYLFGFSRGAYTVRALGAFISQVGYIKNVHSLTDAKLEEKINILVAKYHSNRRKKDKTTLDSDSCEGKIKAICVWDTVAALGLPFDIGLRTIIQKLFFSFNFKDFKLSDKVEKAYQALAIDDERATFHPLLWDESDESKERKRISQVWFSGVHSNVGGGYPKQELSYVTLYWMIQEIGDPLGKGGVRFNQSFLPEVISNMNVHGKLYDSRAGIASYYRYEPRNIENLCSEREVTPVIHSSVWERIRRKTDGYAPSNLVRTYLNSRGPKNSSLNVHDKWSHTRMLLYFCFACISLIAGAFLFKFWTATEKVDLGNIIEWVLCGIFAAIILAKIKESTSYWQNKSLYYPDFLRYRTIYSSLVAMISGGLIYVSYLMSQFQFCGLPEVSTCESKDVLGHLICLTKALFEVYQTMVVTFAVLLVAVLILRRFLKRNHQEMVQSLYY